LQRSSMHMDNSLRMSSNSPIRRSQQLQQAAAGPSCPASPQPLRRSVQLEMLQQQQAAALPRLHRSRGLQQEQQQPLPAVAAPPPDLIYRNSGALLGRGDTPRPSPAPEGAPSSAAAALAERLRAEAPEPSSRLPPRVIVTPAPGLPVKKKKSYSLIKLLSRTVAAAPKPPPFEAQFSYEHPAVAGEFVLNCDPSEDEATIKVYERGSATTVVAPTVIGSMQSRPAVANDVQYKWKVKRRCDGSRYVVKRPVRSQVLKKREAQLLRERPGITTDDDALSYIKLGQFIPRDDRKRLLDREKAKKRRRQQKVLEAAESACTEQPIISLSQLKQHRKQADMLLDDFSTTREWLSQRNRLEPTSTTSRRPSTGIPTVTTV
ncbi:hypothetical protein PFISCL1PPCAC_16953, partial [Pristionchus fissidentatus]